MSSPRHSPPPSAAAPKPKGILKNPGAGPTTSPGVEGSVDTPTEGTSHLAWDESNLTLHEIQREQQDPRMKIDEPKTPFVRSASFGSVDDDTKFDLDGQGSEPLGAVSTAAPSTVAQDSYFASSENTGTQASDIASVQPVTSSARRGSAAEVLAANTKANAGLSGISSGTTSLAGAVATPAVGLDSADLVQQQNNTSSRSSSRRDPDSRSPSFTLPSSRRSSATGDRSRDGVREEMRSRTDGGDIIMNGVEGAIDDDDHVALDPEERAKHDAFARKRNAHYGKEAEAMKIAAALAAREEDDVDDEEE